MAGGTRLASILLLSVFLVVRGQDDIREPPKITEPASAKELFYDGGVDVTLQCSATGEPTPLYEWYWNGAPIEPTNQAISYDPSTGLLTIKALTVREEGYYNCRARNTFRNGVSAVAISHTIEVRRARLEPWTKDQDRIKPATEGNYVSITCGDNLPMYYGPTTFGWYTVEGDDDLKEVYEDERLFIDNKGTLHFTYAMRTDEQSNRYYSCAMSNSVEGQITLGGRTRLVVKKSDSIAEVKPALQFSTQMAGQAALTFERNTIGHLECFFSAYVNDPGNEVPTIDWQDNAGNTIVSGTDRYTIESNGRVLKIASLEEADEKPYTCIGRNRVGTAEGRMTLNVTSSPIWVRDLQSTTVPQGKDAVFYCEARSAAGEVHPDTPRWLKNGQRLDVTYDPNKFRFSDNKRALRVKSAQKNTDIACFQCYVGNSVGEEFSDGCLNVILPIEFIAKPPPEQTIERGDIVNLTVVATSDKLYPVAYKWRFNNTTYEGGAAPPYVIYDVNTKLAYINTSDLTDQQMRDIRGVYSRQVYHEFETVFVNVEVKLADEPVENDDSNVVMIAVLGAVGGILVLVIVLVVLYKRKVRKMGCHPPNGAVFYAVPPDGSAVQEDQASLDYESYHDYSEIPDSAVGVDGEENDQSARGGGLPYDMLDTRNVVDHTYRRLHRSGTEDDDYNRPVEYSPETTNVKQVYRSESQDKKDDGYLHPVEYSPETTDVKQVYNKKDAVPDKDQKNVE